LDEHIHQISRVVGRNRAVNQHQINDENLNFDSLKDEWLSRRAEMIKQRQKLAGVQQKRVGTLLSQAEQIIKRTESEQPTPREINAQIIGLDPQLQAMKIDARIDETEGPLKEPHFPTVSSSPERTNLSVHGEDNDSPSKVVSFQGQ
jgi:ribosome-binding protein aMBF1 (putative translation factor)